MTPIAGGGKINPRNESRDGSSALALIKSGSEEVTSHPIPFVFVKKAKKRCSHKWYNLWFDFANHFPLLTTKLNIAHKYTSSLGLP